MLSEVSAIISSFHSYRFRLKAKIGNYSGIRSSYQRESQNKQIV